MNTITKKHHITGTTITGYGEKHFARNYNSHTMNECKNRDEKDFLPENFELNRFEELFKKEPVTIKKITSKKTTKKATKK